MSASIGNTTSSRRKEAESEVIENAWNASQLVPLMLRAPPTHALQVMFDRPAKKKGGAWNSEGIPIGDTIEVDKLKNPPALDWPQDSDNPEALYTVACVDLDEPNPELLNRPKERRGQVELPAYRTTNLANAPTPPMQRFVWLLVNVPAPHLIHNGHRLAQWDPDIDDLKEKQELRRMVLLVFKQLAPIPRHKAPEDSMEAKDRRVASLARFLSRHAEVGVQAPWAGSFFIVDTQSDEQYAASKRVEDMMKPLREPVDAVSQRIKQQRRPYSPKWKGMDQYSPYATPDLAPLPPPKMSLPEMAMAAAGPKTTKQAGAETKGAKTASGSAVPDSERKEADPTDVRL